MQVRSLRSFSQTVFHKTLHCLSAQECCIPISIPSGHSMLPGLDSIERTMQCCGDGVRIGGECGHFDSRALLDAVRKVPHMTEAQRLGLLLLLTIRHMQRLREQVFRDTNYKSSKTCEIQDKNSNIEAAGDFRDETYGRICEESEWFVEEALWTSFPLMDGGESGQSVIDALFIDDCAYTEISTHWQVTDVLMTAWKKGKPGNSLGDMNEATSFHRVRRRASPRVMHMIELTFHFSYLGLLSDYVLDPQIQANSHSPSWVAFPHSSTTTNRTPGSLEDWRVLTLLAYALSRTLHRTPDKRSQNTYFCVLAMLLLHIAHNTLPKIISHSNIFQFASTMDVGHIGLVLMLVWHIFELHTTRPPSPTLLFAEYAPQLFPMSCVVEILSNTWLTCLAIFTPVIYVGTAMLVVFGQELGVLKLGVGIGAGEEVSVKGHEHYTVPSIFAISLFGAVSLFLLTTFHISSLQLRSNATAAESSRHHRHPWNTYGIEAGFQSRKAMYNAINAYSKLGTLYYFPPPLNLPAFVLVDLPVLALAALGRKDMARRVEQGVMRVVWGIFVLPFVWIFLFVRPV